LRTSGQQTAGAALQAPTVATGLMPGVPLVFSVRVVPAATVAEPVTATGRCWRRFRRRWWRLQRGRRRWRQSESRYRSRCRRRLVRCGHRPDPPCRFPDRQRRGRDHRSRYTGAAVARVDRRWFRLLWLGVAAMPAIGELIHPDHRAYRLQTEWVTSAYHLPYREPGSRPGTGQSSTEVRAPNPGTSPTGPGLDRASRRRGSRRLVLVH
jgi:hypothetical protein